MSGRLTGWQDADPGLPRRHVHRELGPGLYLPVMFWFDRPFKCRTDFE
jgi:hypothetical protein